MKNEVARSNELLEIDLENRIKHQGREEWMHYGYMGHYRNVGSCIRNNIEDNLRWSIAKYGNTRINIRIT